MLSFSDLSEAAGDPHAHPSGRATEALLAATLRTLMPVMSARAARRAGGDKGLRADLERAAMLEIAEAVQRYDPAKGIPLSPFVMMYAKRRLADEQRRVRGALARDPLAASVSAPVECLDEIADQATPLDMVLATEFEGMLQTLYPQLPERHAFVAKSLVERGLTQADISRELGVSRTAVTKMLARVRARVEAFSPLMEYLRAA